MLPEEIGKARRAIHRSHNPGKLDVHDNDEQGDIIGAYGESTFGFTFHLLVDENLYINGDGGKDFELRLHDNHGEPHNYIVNVKTYLKPNNLPVLVSEINKPVDIYVLAGLCWDSRICVLLGWQWANVMRQQEIHNFGLGPSHYMKRDRLRSMWELAQRVVP